MTVEERLWARVAVGDCWEWTGSTTMRANGYGQIKVDRRNVTTHRLAYELLVGPVPPGMQLDHLCRNRLCCNPDHLEPVSAAANVRRGWGPGGRHARKTHCPQGHPYDAANTGTANGGRSRRCLACKRTRSAVAA